MKKLWKTVLMVAGSLLIVFTILALFTRRKTREVILHPLAKRPRLLERPEDYGMACEEVTVKTVDGLKLYGWYIHGSNGATIMIQHGSPGGRQDGLVEAEFLNRHGYNVLMGSFRAHDECEGVIISYGYHEVKDIAAWHQYLLGRGDLDPQRIGLFGESMGGETSILYTAQNEDVKVLVTASAPAITQQTIEAFIQYETGLPSWITPVLARLFVFWVEKEAGIRIEDVDTEAVIGQISPIPVLIIQGGKDTKIDVGSGQRLYDAAGEPKEFWFVPEAGHVNFEDFRPEEYEQRVVSFFDQILLDG